MAVDIVVYRLRIGLHHYRHSKFKSSARLDVFDYYTWLRMLLLKDGDIELNPGPILNPIHMFLIMCPTFPM